MTTTIISNGSKWAGEEPHTIEKLIEVLGEYPLDRSFEGFGNFVISPTLRHDNVTRFFGNFFTLSHVFSIDSDEPEIVSRLTSAIRENQRRQDYLAQPSKAQRERARIAEIRLHEQRRAAGA